jgi:hypothetical protein
MRITINKIFLLLALIVSVSSCVTTDVIRLNNKNYSKVNPEDVRVFMKGDKIKQKFVKIAIINAKGSSTYTSESKLIKKSKKKAAEMGANAIVLGSIHEPSSGAKIAGAVLGVGTNHKSEVIAIRLLGKKNN